MTPYPIGARVISRDPEDCGEAGVVVGDLVHGRQLVRWTTDAMWCSPSVLAPEGAIVVCAVEWSPAHQRDVATVLVDGAVYHLPLAEDRHAATGHGGGSTATWAVDDVLSTDADDESIGNRYDAIGEAVTEYMTRSDR